MPIADRTVTGIRRPALGQLHFSDGTTRALERPMILGRKPREDAVIGGEAAEAIRLPDPERVLSRSHVEVRLVDWQVQIVDLDSMNHTYVTVPGQSPLQLRPAEPFPIPLGSTIRLGDAISFTYEAGLPS